MIEYGGSDSWLLVPHTYRAVAELRVGDSERLYFVNFEPWHDFLSTPFFFFLILETTVRTVSIIFYRIPLVLILSLVGCTLLVCPH